VQSLNGHASREAAPDVLVVGGGVVGCSIAYHLALRGLSVTLLEASHLAAGASGVAAGMLAPQVEAPFADPFFDLTLKGRAEHGPLAQALLEDVGLDVEHRVTGVLHVAETEGERADLQRQLRWQTALGLRAEWLEPDDLGQFEPLLAGVAGRLLAGGTWLPDEAQVRSPRLVQALAMAAIKHGAHLREATPVLNLELAGERVVGVRTPTGTLSAGVVILAAGVWSANLAQLAGLALPLGPVKGQIVTLQGLNVPLRHILWSGDCYLAPKADGQVVLGATEEEGNYDPRPSLAGMGRLTEAALELAPAAGRFSIEGIWGGLRPAAPDRRPIVGWAPGIDALLLATAHFRNGILLGPLTGRRIAEHLAGEAPTFAEFAPFSPGRFLTPAEPATATPN
jgi:glycine oxidase